MIILSIIVEMSSQTTFGDKKFLRPYIKFEGLAANLQNSLICKWSLDFWCMFVSLLSPVRITTGWL